MNRHRDKVGDVGRQILYSTVFLGCKQALYIFGDKLPNLMFLVYLIGSVELIIAQDMDQGTVTSDG